jgi:hypothetical protein
MPAAGAIYGYGVLPAAFVGSLLLRLLAFGVPTGRHAVRVQSVMPVRSKAPAPALS